MEEHSGVLIVGRPSVGARFFYPAQQHSGAHGGTPLQITTPCEHSTLSPQVVTRVNSTSAETGLMIQTPIHVSTSEFLEIAKSLAATAKSLHARGWMLGTSGNLSAVVHPGPLLMAMSASGVDKGELSAEQILLVDEHAQVVFGPGAKPSDETLLHLEIVKQRGAGAVLHTHSVWNTILSDLFADQRGLTIDGYEMLKGLAGVKTHEHRELLPIIDNSQDMHELAASMASINRTTRRPWLSLK